MLRLVLLGLAAWWLLHPFFTGLQMGTGDAVWYSNVLADFVTQLRAGIFPVFVGQSEYAFNGAVYPLRVAPLYQHLAGLIDLLTGQRFGWFALQHACVIVMGFAGMYASYWSLSAIARDLHDRRRACEPSDALAASRFPPAAAAPRSEVSAWGAALLAVLYLSCPGILGTVYTQDLYMTWMTVPFLPVAVYGAVRCFLRGDLAADLWLAGGLAALWWAHSPVALWSTLLLGAVRVLALIVPITSGTSVAAGTSIPSCRGGDLHRPRLVPLDRLGALSESNGQDTSPTREVDGAVDARRLDGWRRAAIGGAVFVALAHYPFLSVATLGLGGAGSAITSGLSQQSAITNVIREAFPAVLLPLSENARALSDLQLGWGLWGIAILTAIAWGMGHGAAAVSGKREAASTSGPGPTYERALPSSPLPPTPSSPSPLPSSPPLAASPLPLTPSTSSPALAPYRLPLAARSPAAALLACAAVLLLLLTPIPFLNDWLWANLPEQIKRITFYWPMHRFYLIAAGLIAAAGMLGIEMLNAVRSPLSGEASDPRSETLKAFRTALPPHTSDPRSETRKAFRPKASTAFATLLTLAATWSMFEARQFVRAGRERTASPEVTARTHRGENLLLMNHSFGLFPALPPWFSNGVMDPRAEAALITSPEADRGASAASSIIFNRLRGVPDTNPGIVRFEPTLRLEPGKRYELLLRAREGNNLPYEGTLQLLGTSLFREYALPSTGAPEAFGLNGAKPMSLWTTARDGDTVTLRFIPGGTAGKTTDYLDFGSYLFREANPTDQSVQVTAFIPFAAQIRTGEPMTWVDTPRMWIPGYAARHRTENAAWQTASVAQTRDGTVAINVPGTSEVELSYRAPLALRLSYWTSLAAWSAALAAAAVSIFRSRSETH